MTRIQKNWRMIRLNWSDLVPKLRSNASRSPVAVMQSLRVVFCDQGGRGFDF